MADAKLVLIGRAALAGVCATVTMDVLATVFRRLGHTVGAKGSWVGRWYLGILRGQLVHANIAAAREREGEVRAAWVGHYAIGAALAIVYAFGTGWLAVPPDSILAALGFGLLTCVFPWFLLFPAIGFGWLGLGGPPELRLFTSSLVNHLSYGLGLWWAAKVLSLG